MKFHYLSDDRQPICGKVSGACAAIASHPIDVTCRLCLKKLRAVPVSSVAQKEGK